MTSSKPTLLFVQGAYQTPEFYGDLEQHFQSFGYPVIHPVLPTCSDVEAEDFPERTVSDDAKLVKGIAEKLLQDGKTVIMVMHSYGGIVGNEAITKDMSLTERKANGLKGGVAHLVLIASVAMPEGYSIVKGSGNVKSLDTEDTPDGRTFYRAAVEKLLYDLPEADQQKWAAKIIPLPTITMKYEITNCAWRYIPSTYFIMEQDRVMPRDVQEMSAKSIDGNIEHIAAGHIGVLTHTDLIATKVDQILQALNL